MIKLGHMLLSIDPYTGSTNTPNLIMFSKTDQYFQKAVNSSIIKRIL